jgi:hypothetical protein
MDRPDERSLFFVLPVAALAIAAAFGLLLKIGAIKP